MKNLILIAAFLCQSLYSAAQLYVAPGTDLFIEEQTIFVMDSLLLIPLEPLTLNGQTIDKSYAPITSVAGVPGIERVYTFSPALDVYATMGMYYADAELNANNEAQLSVALTNGGNLDIRTGSRVIPLSNRITRKVDAALDRLTAAAQPATCSRPPAAPAGIIQTPTAKPCPGETRVYSVQPVTGATSYKWTEPMGGIITGGQGTNSVTVTFGSTFTSTSEISVYAINDCGSGIKRIKSIGPGLPPTAPGIITGDVAGLCEQVNVPYSVVDKGYQYTWSFDVPQAVVKTGQGTSSITADFGSGFTQAKLTVTATNGCGVGPGRVLNAIRPLPAKPGPIAGSAVVCPLQQNVSYSIPAIAGAVTYTWVSPVGSVISDGVTTSTLNSLITASNSVTVNFGNRSGSVKVRGNNSCGGGSSASLLVSTVCTFLKEASPSETATLTLYPNPAKDIVNLDLTAATAGLYKMNVTDMLGRELIGKEWTLELGGNTLTIDVSELVPGTYHLSLKPLEPSGPSDSYQASFVIQ